MVLKRSRIRQWRTRAWLAVAAAGLVLFIVFPLLSPAITLGTGSSPSDAIGRLERAEGLLNFSMIGFLAIWLFAIGSSFASFLNVVAWRVPNGRSILGSSHCPYCNVELTFRHNIPVIGWIKNHGRCFHCRLPISPRYLIVEIVLGAVFLFAALTTLLTDGGLIPFSEDPNKFSLRHRLFDPRPELLSILALHLSGVMTLFTFVLVEQERRSVPASIWMVGAVLLIAIGLSFPDALVVPYGIPFFDTGPISETSVATKSVFCGLITGMGLGVVAEAIFILRNRPKKAANAGQSYFGLSVVGAMAGWQSAIVVGTMWLITFAVFPAQKNDAEESAALAIDQILDLPHTRMLIVTLLHLLSWRWLELVG